MKKTHYSIKRIKRDLLAGLLLLSLPALLLSAGNKIHLVDWEKGVIISEATSAVSFDSTGRPCDNENGTVISLNRGRINAYNEAREKALEQLIESLKTIRVDPDYMLTDFIEESTITQSRLSALIAQKVRVMEYPAGFNRSGCRATLRIGHILAAIPYTYPSHDFPARMDNPISTDYTGLIIDTRGLNVEPMLLPSIYNEEGLEIYGRFFVDIRHASKYGIVSYAHNEKAASRLGHAGNRPYYTVAIKDIKGCPVLSERDVRKIFSSPATVEALKKCRVIFLVKKG